MIWNVFHTPTLFLSLFSKPGMHIGVVWIRNFCVHRWGISFVNFGRMTTMTTTATKTTVANWLEATIPHSISMHHYLLVLALLAAYLTLSQMYLQKPKLQQKHHRIHVNWCKLTVRGRINNCNLTKWLWLWWNTWICDHFKWNTAF